jgi:hypothetical protein
MNFQLILFVGVIIELCFVQLSDAKRSFGITRSRSKSNKGPAVRRNGHGHEYDDPPLPPPKPSAPDMKKMHSHSPQGPPPAYPGLGSQPVPHHMNPPAYNPSYGHPPAYPSSYHQTGFAPHPAGLNNFGTPYGGVGSVAPMGVMPIAFQPQRSSGSGMMGNLFAGLAGYQLARAFGGGHGYHNHHDREVIVIDNRNEPSQGAIVPTPPPGELPLNLPENTQQQNSQNQLPSSTEIPQEPNAQNGLVMANNEYNHYGLPQYGIPLYGYALPSQTTSYYQTQTMNLSPQPPPAMKK